MKDCILYQHRRLDTNQVFYVGIGKGKRAYSIHNRNKHWNRIVSKYGYSVEILETNLSWEKAQALEIGLIAMYGRRDLDTGSLVNMSDGGEGCYGMIHLEQTKKKISDSHKGKILSNSHKEKLRIAQKGKTFSVEVKNKMSEKRKKKVIDTLNGVIYDSVGEAALSFGYNRNTLYNWLLGIYPNKSSLVYFN